MIRTIILAGFLFQSGIVLGNARSISAGIVPKDTVHIKSNARGRIFEGIGAVNNGGSSKLLIDYPEPYRKDILDYLFKPNFGAGFTYLKVEIGGDGNTTSGAEPSFARTRTEMATPNYNRGYEYWLMKEAVKRNPAVELDALQWSMPGWFKGIWSEDNANYLVKFIQGAKHWGLKMKYIGGCWNEREYDRNWVVNTLRPTLDQAGFKDVKIVAPEGAGGKNWAICDELIKDTVFRNTLSAVSYHYPDSYMWSAGKDFAGESAFNCGLPLWAGEAFSLPGASWKNTTYMAKDILKCYIKQKIVKVNMWCLVAGMPDNSCFSNTGIMKTVDPWSGHYEVWPTIWAIAHFNQFVQPGWQFIDSGCGMLPGDGAYCTYKSPDGRNDYSIVAVTGDVPQQKTFAIDDLHTTAVHVWKSNSEDQFIKQGDIKVVNGSFTIAMDAESIYTVTTTKGQMKGKRNIPKPVAFPVSYTDNFDQYSLDQAPLSPKYFFDNSGAFELYKAPGESQCLRQMLTNDITHWIPDECAYSYVAQGVDWSHGEFSSDVYVEEDAFNGPGFAGIVIRASYDKASQANIPFGYRLNLYKNGTWKLETKTSVLAEGKVKENAWHNLKLRSTAETIAAFIDGIKVAEIKDNTYTVGAAGYTSGWNKAKFDNLSLSYEPVKGVVVSDWKDVSASVNGDAAINAFDGNSYSRWNGGNTDQAQFLKVDLGRNYDVTRCESFMEFSEKGYSYQIEYSLDDKNWKMFADKSNNRPTETPCYVDVNKVRGRWFRLTIKPSANKAIPAVYAFKIYSGS